MHCVPDHVAAAEPQHELITSLSRLRAQMWRLTDGKAERF